MAQVFISHASTDKKLAAAICGELERSGITCWIAPRDVQPGQPYASEIVRGITECGLLLLLYSAESNRSEMVMRELENAASARKPLLPIRLEEVAPSEEMRFYVGREQWIDVRSPDAAALSRVVTAVRGLMGERRNEAGTADDAATTRTADTGAQRTGATGAAWAMPRPGCAVQVVLACTVLAAGLGGFSLFQSYRAAGSSGRPDAAGPSAGNPVDPGAGNPSLPAPSPATSTSNTAKTHDAAALEASVRQLAPLPQLRIGVAGAIVTVTGALAHEDEVAALSSRLQPLGENLRIELSVDPAGVGRALREAVEALGLSNVSVNPRGRPGEPVREIIVRYGAQAGITKTQVTELVRQYFLKPELVSVTEDR